LGNAVLPGLARSTAATNHLLGDSAEEGLFLPGDRRLSGERLLGVLGLPPPPDALLPNPTLFERGDAGSTSRCRGSGALFVTGAPLDAPPRLEAVRRIGAVVLANIFARSAVLLIEPIESCNHKSICCQKRGLSRRQKSQATGGCFLDCFCTYTLRVGARRRFRLSQLPDHP